MTIAFTKVKLPYGWMGNMSPHKVTIGGIKWRTSEHAFQALRLPNDHPVRGWINNIPSPMDAKKMIDSYRGDFVIEERSDDDIEVMRWVTEEKLIQNKLIPKLAETGDQLIVEDTSARPWGNNPFWGAAFVDGDWVGENWLGRLWMEHRDHFCS